MRKITKTILVAAAVVFMTGCETDQGGALMEMLQQEITALNGTDGMSAYQLAVQQGYEGTLTEWLESLNGATAAEGLSAYQLAALGGFEGTQEDWIASLQGAAGIPGDPGAPGMSAYELAVIAGFSGSIDEWLISLVGAAGECECDGLCPEPEPCPETGLCPPELTVDDGNIHFTIWFNRDDLGDFSMQHLIEAGYLPTLNAIQRPGEEGVPDGTGVNEPGMKIEDRHGTTIIHSVMPLEANPAGALQHGMGLQFTQTPGATIDP